MHRDAALEQAGTKAVYDIEVVKNNVATSVAAPSGRADGRAL